MSKDNPTSKQHFLPRFYLKRFANPKGFLQVYDKKNKRVGSPRPYASVGYEHYFYAAQTGVPDDLSQKIEEWLKVYEGIISQELPKIIENILDYQPILPDQRYILAALMCMLWLRTPGMRDHMNKMHEKLMKQMMHLTAQHNVDEFNRETGTKMTETEKENLIKTIREGKFSMRFNNAQHLRFMTNTFGFNDKGFTNMFYGHKWKIYIAKGNRRFVTTDNPVIEWWLPPEDFWGRGSFLERTKYFALTPEIFIELTYPQGNDKIKRKTLFQSDDELVQFFNLMLASRGGSNYVYANDKELLQEIEVEHTNPSKMAISVYKKYDYPWDEYQKKTGEQK